MTGVEVIQSAYRLLNGENPTPDEVGTVASRHSETLGRQLRSKRMRFLRTRADTTALADVEDDEIRLGEAVYCLHKDAIVFVIGSLKGPPAWTNSDVPKQLGDEYYKRDLAALRIGVHAALPPTDTPELSRSSGDSRRTPGQ